MRNNFEAFAPMKCRHQLAPSCVNRMAASLRCKPLPAGTASSFVCEQDGSLSEVQAPA